ncbi:MAG: flagellar export protein FliJ [Lachnospiraceae bacterium]|nr:flagellar export protein FliJ [Lachnospiraceae bacterium]
MAKFIYRMQNILDIKYKLEETEKQNFAAALQRLRNEEEKLQHLVMRRDRYASEYEQLLVGKLDFLKIEQCANAIDFLNEKITDQEQVIRNRSKELEQARQKLNQVIQERKMHEKLKEKQFEQFLQELSMQEIKEIDEVVSYQYGQGKTGTED